MDTLESLKKSNCHLHLTGALSPQVLRDVNSVIEGGGSNLLGLEDHIDFDNPHLWEAAKDTTSTKEGLLLSVAAVVEQELRDNVDYVELTLNPYGMVRRGMKIDDIVETLIVAQGYAEQNGMEICYKYGVNRKDGPESVDLVHDVYIASPDKIRFGIDLNGDELRFSTSDFIDAFRSVSAAGVPTTIHAGEAIGSEQSLKDALTADPVRIGHALAVVHDHRLLDLIRERNITVEVSMVSNIRRRLIASFMTHPIRRLIEQDVSIVFGSDDPAFFDNCMSDELKALGEAGFSDNSIADINDKANIQARSRP